MSFPGWPTVGDEGYAPPNRALALQTDGKMVVGGTTCDRSDCENATKNAFALARLNPSGNGTDTSFGGDARVTTQIPGLPHAYLDDLALQKNGRIVAVGVAYAAHYTSSALTIVRYNANGSLDSTFSGDGIETVANPQPEEDFTATRVAIQSDGKIVVAIRAYDPAYSRWGTVFEVGRFNANGSVDQGFGSNGFQFTQQPPAPNDAGCTYNYLDAFPSDLAIQKDGKILLAGDSEATSDYCYADRLMLARFNANGSVDHTFSSDGMVIDQARTSNYCVGCRWDVGLALTPGGRILALTGWVQGDFYHQHTGIMLSRYRLNGTRDQSFSGDGLAPSNLPNGASISPADMALQADGKIVVTGSSGTSAGEYAVGRYRANGTVDPTFGNGGFQLTGFPNHKFTYASSVAIQQDGKIVVSGDTSPRLGVVRYRGG